MWHRDKGDRIFSTPYLNESAFWAIITYATSLRCHVVSVAQRSRRQVVALEIEGSIPSTHPILLTSPVSVPLMI